MGGKKNVSSACLNCRRRKVKCDGNDSCSNCVTADLKCVYNAHADMRRISAKMVITDLEARILQLEQVLREHNIEQPWPTSTSPARSVLANESRLSPPVLRTQGDVQESREALGTTGGAKPGSVETGMHGIASVQDIPPPAVNSTPAQVTADTDRHAEESEAIGTNELRLPSPVHDPNTTNPDDQPFVLLGTPDFSAEQPEGLPDPSLGHGARAEDLEEDGDITSILSARMGSLRIAEDGQLRYYGPTSNLHIHRDGFQSLSRSTIRHVATDGHEALKRLGLDQELPISLEMYLAKLYFAWEDPAIHVVDEETFFSEKGRWALEEQTSPYYSETLNNAICAIGASLAAGESLGVPEPASEFFSSRAKALLEVEMDSPTVATVQALVVMSASEAAFTRDARGWLYSGMAARLSADLGLHLDVTKQRDGGLLSQHDLEVRQTTFWGVFIHENMWSIYVGRPWGMGIRNVTVPAPQSHFDELESRRWKPYPMARGESSVPDDGIAFPIHACTAANITLCEFMRRINMTLYSGGVMGKEALAQFLVRTKQELWKWHQNIVPSLHIDYSSSKTLYTPAVLQLHMQFYATLILLYRPYLSSKLARCTESANSPDDMAALQEAANDCVSAAHQIAELLRCYQRQHSLRRTNIQIVHIIFTASLVFIHNICTRPYSESRASLHDLQLCCHSLGEIGQCYGNATRALEVIILVKCEWQRIAVAQQARNASLKRSNTSISAGRQHGANDDRHKRRHRTSSSAADSFDTPVFVMPPPSLSMSQMLSDDYAGSSSTMPAPSLGDHTQELWNFPDIPDFVVDDAVVSMNWFDGQLLEEILVPTANLINEGAAGQQMITSRIGCPPSTQVPFGAGQSG
ncbi:fungal-specific transcription factor domain-containing protein [Thelonectria olida]|uniref:Fungal-specific transcription factor domain-containing protein n=1 Tax=Thelonectria olida TaxID=1576542 RepID=A0A9P8VRH8_9HYPO|nr:fungal-specific transcription factor domain-containing protein [Thelonectria olida]